MTSEAVANGDAVRAADGRTTKSGVGRTRPRRRPSGEAPPLPRQLSRSGRFWLMLAGGVLAFLLLVGLSGVVTLRLDAFEAGVLHGFARLRNGPATAVLSRIDGAISPAVLLIWWVALAVMLIWRRWRHLFVWIGTMFLVTALGDLAAGLIMRPRPLGVEILTSWSWLLDAVPAGRRARRDPHQRPVRAGAGGPLRDRGKWVVDRDPRRGGVRPALPRRRPPDRRADRHRPRRRRTAGRVAAAGAQRPLPGHVPSAGGRRTWTYAAAGARRSSARCTTSSAW